MSDAPTTPALDALAAAGTPHRVVRTPRAGSAEESAELQGIPLGALLRTIVVRRGDDDYLFVLVPAGRRFDWPRLRAHLGVRRLTLPGRRRGPCGHGLRALHDHPVRVDSAVAGDPGRRGVRPARPRNRRRRVRGQRPSRARGPRSGARRPGRRGQRTRGLSAHGRPLSLPGCPGISRSSSISSSG